MRSARSGWRPRAEPYSILVQTELGERFRDEADAAYMQLEVALAHAESATRTQKSHIRAGMLSPLSAGPTFPSIVQAFERRHPACQVVVPWYGVADQFSAAAGRKA